MQALDDRDLLGVTGGYRADWIVGQALNGAVLGGMSGALAVGAGGAVAGSVVPGLGTATGAGAGVLIGGINGAAIGAAYGGYNELKRQQRDGVAPR